MHNYLNIVKVRNKRKLRIFRCPENIRNIYIYIYIYIKNCFKTLCFKKNYFKTSTLICPFCTPVKSSNECYHFKHAPKFKMQSHISAGYLASDKGWESF